MLVGMVRDHDSLPSGAPQASPATLTASNRRGFSLVEVLIVVVIIGILAGVVMVNYSRSSTDAFRAIAEDFERQLRSGAAMQFSRSGLVPSSFATFVDADPAPPTTGTVTVDANIRTELQDPGAQVVFGNELRLDFRNGLRATYTINAQGVIVATYTGP
jgi:prepilin-type N-terminal cleavage/methylation domain-containing protein